MSQTSLLVTGFLERELQGTQQVSLIGNHSFVYIEAYTNVLFSLCFRKRRYFIPSHAASCLSSEGQHGNSWVPRDKLLFRDILTLGTATHIPPSRLPSPGYSKTLTAHSRASINQKCKPVICILNQSWADESSSPGLTHMMAHAQSQQGTGRVRAPGQS